MKKLKGLIMIDETLFEEKFYFENQKNIVDGIVINTFLPIIMQEAMARSEVGK